MTRDGVGRLDGGCDKETPTTEAGDAAGDRKTPRAESNRKNAKRSTGPKSEKGKAASSRNAAKHGLTAKKLVLDDEDRAAYDARLGEWLGHYRPADPATKAVIERAVYQTWTLDRCARYEAAKTGERVRHAAARYDFSQKTHAETVGRRLIHEPIDRCRMPEIYDPVVRDRIQKRVDDDPAMLHLELTQSAAGVDWLLARWAELAEMLRFHGFWHYPEKLQALRLLGKRPEDVVEDPEVGRILLACHASHPEPWDFLNEAIQTKLGLEHRPMYYVQVEDIKGLLPATPDEGVEFLRSVIRTETTRLRRLKSDGLDAVDHLDRRGAADRALFDDTPAGALFHRYEAACDRALHTSIRDLTALLDRAEAAPATAPSEPAAAPINGPDRKPAPAEPPKPAPEAPARPTPGPRSTRPDSPPRNEATSEMSETEKVMEIGRDGVRVQTPESSGSDGMRVRLRPGRSHPAENRAKTDPR